MNNRKITLKEFEDQIKAKEEVQEALLKYISKGESEYVKGLLGNVAPTADVNLADPHGETPLFIAAKNGNYNTVKILLEAKADTNATANHGKTLRDVTKDVDCMVLLKAANPGLFKPAKVEAPVVAKAHNPPTEKKHRNWF